MMRSLLVFASAICAFSAAPVLAADLYAAAPAGTVYDTGDHDWTGLYIGGSVSYSWQTANTEFTGPLMPPIPETNPAGLLGGVQIGANYQTGIIVLGVEAAFSLSNISATSTDPLVGAPQTVTSSTDYAGSLLAKLGVSMGPVLPYLVAGVAASHVKTTATAGGADDDGIFSGFAVGAGVEFAVDDNWSIRSQYLYTNLNGDNFNVGQAWETSSNPVGSTVTAGINYRF